jgi:hypothetical protein
MRSLSIGNGSFAELAKASKVRLPKGGVFAFAPSGWKFEELHARLAAVCWTRMSSSEVDAVVSISLVQDIRQVKVARRNAKPNQGV